MKLFSHNRKLACTSSPIDWFNYTCRGCKFPEYIDYLRTPMARFVGPGDPAVTVYDGTVPMAQLSEQVEWMGECCEHRL